MRRLAALLVTAIALAGCSGGDDDTSAPATSAAELASGEAAALRPFETAVPLCDDVPDPADSLDWSGVQRADVPFPARTGEALVLALGFPYVVDYWGGTGDREGWIVIGVSGGAVELQAMLDQNYPGARVLAMPLDWTPTELLVLADEVDRATSELLLTSPAVVSISRGVVRVQLGEITEDRAAGLDRFAGQRVCIDGAFA